MRLIDADALKDTLYEVMDKYDGYDPDDGKIIQGLMEADELINTALTIEAAPVVHGRWEAVHDGWGLCPNCHRMDSIHEKATHCRFCGTKMDGGVSDG